MCRKLMMAVVDRKLTRSQDSQLSAADLSCICRMRRDLLVPEFSDSRPQRGWANDFDRTQDAVTGYPYPTLRLVISLLWSNGGSLNGTE